MYAARRRGRVAGEVGRRYVGTGILRCGEPGCGAKLSARKGDGFYKDTDVRRSYYTCAKERRGCGKVSADVRSVDRELRTLVVARLSDPRYAAALEAARVMVNARLASVQAEIASCEAVQAGLSERLGRREITLDAFDRANEPLVRDLARLYQERDAMPGGSPHETAESQLPELIEARWDAAEVTERRSMLVQALGRSTLHLDRYQRGPGKQAFDRKRLRLADKEPA